MLCLPPSGLGAEDLQEEVEEDSRLLGTLGDLQVPVGSDVLE